MKNIILSILYFVSAALLLTGCYETDFPIIDKGEKVGITGVYKVYDATTDKYIETTEFIEQKKGVGSFASYSYKDSNNDTFLFKKLSSGLYLLQQKLKSGKVFDYAFIDPIDDKTVLMLIPDFFTKENYLNALIKKSGIKGEWVLRSKIKYLKLKSDDNKKILKLFNKHDKSLLMVIKRLQKVDSLKPKKTKSIPNHLPKKKLAFTSMQTIVGSNSGGAGKKQLGLKEKEKLHPHYQLCEEAGKLSGHEPYYIPFKTTSNLSIRNAPSIKSKKIGLLKKGEKVDGECTKFDVLNSKVSGYWIYIGGFPPNEKYVFSHYLEPLESEARGNANILKRETEKEIADEKALYELVKRGDTSEITYEYLSTCKHCIHRREVEKKYYEFAEAMMGAMPQDYLDVCKICEYKNKFK